MSKPIRIVPEYSLASGNVMRASIQRTDGTMHHLSFLRGDKQSYEDAIDQHKGFIRDAFRRYRDDLAEMDKPEGKHFFIGFDDEDM